MIVTLTEQQRREEKWSVAEREQDRWTSGKFAEVNRERKQQLLVSVGSSVVPADVREFLIVKWRLGIIHVGHKIVVHVD